MPRIFDNIELALLPAFRDTIKLSYRADFCVGYFNLRGWRRIGDLIEAYIGNQGACCRLLVGMQSLPADRTRSYFPDRIPKTIKFSSETSATNSPLDFEEIVEVINARICRVTDSEITSPKNPNKSRLKQNSGS
ncbi:hypothetical protein Q5692_10330 [Microcoleus sp. C2C3]|uniref:hypothetical protein n=1 Tax=unclassified Microcoleus TaxID=2642155 RepID=UPI002FD74437